MNNTHNESGRSMVEMLGVLAIIGVLSVGGIAGYTAAINRINFNKYTNLIQTVAMSVTAENAKGENSMFKTGMADTLSGATKWCQAYGSEWCKERRLNKENYVLSEAEVGAKFNGKGGVTGVYWSIVSGKEQTYCYNNTDIVLNVHNVKASTCEKLVDVIFDHYADVVVGFSGAHTASIAVGRDTAKKMVCRKNDKLLNGDMNEITTMFIYFAGEEDETTATGKCMANCPDSPSCG